jgi:hypothetical protein
VKVVVNGGVGVEYEVAVVWVVMYTEALEELPTTV